MKAVFLDFATVSRSDLDVAALKAILPGIELFDVTHALELPGRIAGAEVVITNKIRIDAAAIAAARNLRLVALVATGTNNVDLGAARERGVAVCNIRGYCTASVVQHVYALILALTHHLAGYQRLLQEGAWRESPQFCLLDYPIRELVGKTLGIVGFGELGQGVARAAPAFGLEVLIAERRGAPLRAGRMAFDELLGRADILSLHCPLTPETARLIGAAELRRMRSDAVLINTARGALVDERALADALRARAIGGAGIDVLSEEPPVGGNPLLAGDIPNLIVTPHIAWAAREARQRALDEVVANVADFLAGGQRGRVP
ncbi:MAG: D-2-hydroxyacid dehydrogenase [Gammaproteobacteria bacterium]